MRLVLQNVEFNLRLIGKFTTGELAVLAHESTGQATTTGLVIAGLSRLTSKQHSESGKSKVI